MCRLHSASIVINSRRTSGHPDHEPGGARARKSAGEYTNECHPFDIQKLPTTKCKETRQRLEWQAQHNYNTKQLKSIYNVNTMAVHKKKSRDEDHLVEPAARRGAESEMRRVGRRRYWSITRSDIKMVRSEKRLDELDEWWIGVEKRCQNQSAWYSMKDGNCFAHRLWSSIASIQWSRARKLAERATAFIWSQYKSNWSWNLIRGRPRARSPKIIKRHIWKHSLRESPRIMLPTISHGRLTNWYCFV